MQKPYSIGTALIFLWPNLLTAAQDASPRYSFSPNVLKELKRLRDLSQQQREAQLEKLGQVFTRENADILLGSMLQVNDRRNELEATRVTSALLLVRFARKGILTRDDKPFLAMIKNDTPRVGVRMVRVDMCGGRREKFIPYNYPRAISLVYGAFQIHDARLVLRQRVKNLTPKQQAIFLTQQVTEPSISTNEVSTWRIKQAAGFELRDMGTLGITTFTEQLKKNFQTKHSLYREHLAYYFGLEIPPPAQEAMILMLEKGDKSIRQKLVSAALSEPSGQQFLTNALRQKQITRPEVLSSILYSFRTFEPEDKLTILTNSLSHPAARVRNEAEYQLQKNKEGHDIFLAVLKENQAPSAWHAARALATPRLDDPEIFKLMTAFIRKFPQHRLDLYKELNRVPPPLQSSPTKKPPKSNPNTYYYHPINDCPPVPVPHEYLPPRLPWSLPCPN